MSVRKCHNGFRPIRIGVVIAALMAMICCFTVQVEAREVDGLELVPYNLVNFGLSSYGRAFGHFPDTWAQVVEAGIVQVELSVPGYGVVDPDDTNLDFEGDVAYLGVQPDGSCKFAWKQQQTDNMAPAPGVKVCSIGSKSPSLSELFTSSASPSLMAKADDERWLKLSAMASVLSYSLSIYDMHMRGAPYTLEDFFSSGYSSIPAGSINPVTNAPLTFDGEASNLIMKPGSPYVTVVDESGASMFTS